MGKIFKIAALVAAVVMIVTACTQNKVDSTISDQSVSMLTGINPPLENIDVPRQTYSINTQQEEIIELDNGTTIVIPESAFVDENGNTIEGEVDIEYREFHNTAQIIACGITMAIQTDAGAGTLQTAGMFEINGSQDGKPVYVAEDKALEVNMASYEEGNDYNFYQLTDDGGNWDQLAAAVPAIQNERKAEKLKELEQNKPVEPYKPQAATEDDIVFDLDIDTRNMPQLQSFADLLWAFVPHKDFIEVNETHPVFNTEWHNVSVAQYGGSSNFYKLSVTNGQGTQEFLVKPVVSDDALQGQLKDFNLQMEQYNAQVDMYNKMIEKAEKEAELVRSFQVRGFGIYNWDRICRMDNLHIVNANFKGLSTDDIAGMSLFLVTGEGKALVRYNQHTWNKLSYDPGQDNTLIAVLNDNRVAYFSEKDFEQLDLPPGSREKPTQYTFELTEHGEELASVDDLHKLLQSI